MVMRRDSTEEEERERKKATNTVPHRSLSRGKKLKKGIRPASPGTR